ncbi:MAG: SUMF1/EgtB/PvdO family nonheme iron enzyme, partial [Bacteroidales bacterium]|nr:SUMF1/EgtB/PvdO family nonheme iron enzyme [Bacteroidales bacterium]
MIRFRNLSAVLFAAALLASLASCKKEVSQTTGWEYNNPQMGGFEVASARSQITGPGLVLIEGGSFTMGANFENLTYEWDNIPRRVTVPSFYMDQTEVSNLAYLEYLHWLYRVFGQDFPSVVRNARPDTLVWREKLAYNEPLVENYLRHPAYHDYPVVGVTWIQANDFCLWRTDRVNELLLIKEGVLDFDPDQKNRDNFNTDSYLAGQYQGLVNKPKADLDPSSSGERGVRLQDGILLPKYRLPTEAEWEYAALGLIGNTLYERVVERRIYPWNGNYLRTDQRKYYGSFVANFKRTSGDYMGVAGNLNDGADLPAPVGSYWPNDYGLYNMAGNVAEWTLDVYRPLSPETVADYAPFRGNVFTKPATDADGFLLEKDSLGRMPRELVTIEESMDRTNYRKADNINYADGDFQTNISTDWLTDPGRNTTSDMYNYGVTSLITDKSRVVKGGSWKDGPYFLSPGTRRYLDETTATNWVGFRCAMI